MATTAHPYSSVITLMAEGGLNFMTGVAKVALCTSSYVPSQTGHVYMSDITAELTDGSYARVEMTGKDQVYSSGTLTLSASDTTFPALVSTGIRYVIFYMEGPTDDTDSPLIGYWDLGTNQNANVNDFKVIYHGAGFMTITLTL